MISPETKIVLGIVASIIGAIGDGVYIYSILRGKTRPHLFTWIIWTVMMGIVCAGQIKAGAGPGAWLTGWNFLANGTIVIVSLLRRGDHHATYGDWLSLIVALCGIPLWAITKDPLWSVCLESAVGIIIFYPTLRKSWNDPYSEHVMSYILFSAPILFQLAAMQNYNLTSLVHPISSDISTLLFVAVLLWRRRTFGPVGLND